MLARPQPPSAICEPGAAPAFVPAPDVLEWLLATFVADGAPLLNEDHAHLVFAQVGVLWTNVVNVRQGRRVLGQAEFKPPTASMGRWQRERARVQLADWFG